MLNVSFYWSAKIIIILQIYGKNVRVGRWKTEDRRPKMEDGRRKFEDGRRKKENCRL